MDASANASMHSNVQTRTCLCAFPGAFAKRSRPHISAALPAHTIISYYLPGEQRGGRGEQLAVTPVPRMSNPVWQLKLDVCVLSASSNSYTEAYK